ncbi:hypothetical protein M422DRAFT_257920 [Sphaerobolus stellatus SS14]|uniref:Uncharacterized protein n=1 Tax=Sphaerobolus stellatus (strain SS14) TaxID=990650 RepID=A0A0C9VNI7_SPHS4|nr:hypothetical protein M422DRAFT_257920 [Sphaerobolus stellatus SS14]
MLYRQPISDEQLAPFLEAAKLMTIPVNEVPPLEIEVPAPSKSSNETILALNQDMIAQATKTNVENVEARRKTEEEEAKRKAEEAAAKKAAEEKDEHAMDANSEGEVEVDKDEVLKSKLKKTKLRPIVDSESEETEEVKAKRRKAKGKGKAINPDVSSEVTSTLETRYPSTTQDVPEFLFARFAKAAKYRRTPGTRGLA